MHFKPSTYASNCEVCVIHIYLTPPPTEPGYIWKTILSLFNHTHIIFFSLGGLMYNLLSMCILAIVIHVISLVLLISSILHLISSTFSVSWVTTSYKSCCLTLLWRILFVTSLSICPRIAITYFTPIAHQIIFIFFTYGHLYRWRIFHDSFTHHFG